ncbi:MAG: hypothetical protein ACRDDF_12715, partial [Aeromonas sp.]
MTLCDTTVGRHDTVKMKCDNKIYDANRTDGMKRLNDIMCIKTDVRPSVACELLNVLDEADLICFNSSNEYINMKNSKNIIQCVETAIKLISEMFKFDYNMNEMVLIIDKIKNILRRYKEKNSREDIMKQNTQRKAFRKIEICNINENRNGKNISCNDTPTIFRAANKEDIYDWLRQFKYYTKLYDGFTENNLQFYAASYLRGDAAKFYDALEIEPRNYKEFYEIMINRYGNEITDRHTILKNFLAKTQDDNQSMKEYCKE